MLTSPFKIPSFSPVLFDGNKTYRENPQHCKTKYFRMCIAGKISLFDMVHKLYFLNFTRLFYIPIVDIQSCVEKGSNYVNVNFGKSISLYILISLFSCI